MAKLQELSQGCGKEPNYNFYLAVPPGIIGLIASQLGKCGLAAKRDKTSLVIEKPFGHDLASAQALNRELNEIFKEGQLYRIDHYMGKETVQNILAFRFANSLFEPLWNRRYIDHVQITVAESHGRRAPRRLLRQGRCSARHGRQPSHADLVHGRHGAAGLLRRQRSPQQKG